MEKTNIVKMDMDLRKAWSNFLMDNDAEICRIKEMAAEIHRNVNQKYDELPYSFHTDMVCNLFMQYGSVCFESESDIKKWGLVAIFGAAFHDTIEDARLTYNDVKSIAYKIKSFDQDEAFLAADIVYALTNEKGKNRAERENDKYFDGVKQTPYAACIKVCDRYANAFYANVRRTSMAQKYSTEMGTFLSRLLITSDDEAPIKPNKCIPEELVNLLESYPVLKTDCNCLLGSVSTLSLLRENKI